MGSVENKLAPPTHVAIVMDGNGRWAKARNLPRTAGHKKGVDAVRAVIEGACELGIKHLTLFGFSSENWNRPQDEVSTLMDLLRFYLDREVSELDAKGVKIRFIGNREKMSADLVERMAKAEAKTQNNQTLELNLALSYGGREEIAQAAQKIAKAVAEGEISPDEVDENIFAENLYTKGTPDPDLLIRTSGEQRISNFLLWQAAYAEFVFTDVLWPDFNKDELKKSVEEYQKRNRRYGKI